MIDEAFGGIQESAVPRKPDALVGPKAVGIELSDLAQRVIAAAMRVTGKVVQFAQLSEDSDVDGAAQCILKLHQISNLVAHQKLTDSGGGECRLSHNVIVPTESASLSEL